MAMFEVWTKCGHVGKKYYVVKSFAVIAENGKEAASIARSIPRVKHHHKDAIINVKRIDKDRFMEIVDANDNDEYLKCSSKQQQNLSCTLEVLEDPHYVDYRYQYEEELSEGSRIHYSGKVKVRNPQKYYKFQDKYLAA